MHVRRALVAIEPMWDLHVTSIKNYTEIFYIFYKGNVLPFQCKKSRDLSMSMGELDGLSLILIDLHVPVLTPRFHWGETAL
jgi:hypothetical protein